MKDKIAQARALGYTDAQIADYLVPKDKLDLARQHKYSDAEILDKLSGGEPPVADIQPLAPETPNGYEPLPGERMLMGIGQLLANSPTQNARDLAGGVAAGGADVIAPFEGSDASAQRKAALSNVIGDQPGVLKSVGQMTAQTGALMGLGGGLAAGAGRVGMSPEIVNALRSAGFAPGLNLQQRLVGSAGTNALAGAMMFPDSPLTAAAGGTAMGAGASYAIPGIAGLLGKGYDWLTGRAPAVRASEVAREAAGPELQAILDAAHAAPANVTATQAAAGINRPEFFALGEDVMNMAPGPRNALLAAQAAERQNALSQLAGGPTQTAARATRESSKNTLQALTDPMRANALELANVGGTMLPAYERQAAEAGANATAAVDDVRRFEAAKGRTRDVFGANPEGFFPGTPQGTPSTGYQNSYMSQLEQKAGAASSAAADTSLAEGGLRRGAEAKAQAIRDMGLKPLDTSNLSDYLRRQANMPGTRADPAQTEVLNDLAAHIEDLAARNGGVIDANDLYQLRKSAANDIIQTKLSARGMNPKPGDKRVAELLGPVKKHIDNAIEAAGGKGWTDYLKTFSEGMRGGSQQELAAEAMRRMQAKNPDGFLKLVRGNDPDAVEAVFGPGSYDIAKEMGAKMSPLNKAASELERDQFVKDAAKKGQASLAKLLRTDRNWTARLLSKVGSIQTGASSDAAVNAIEQTLSDKTKALLAKGFLSGRGLTELVVEMPTVEKEKLIKALAGSAREVSSAIAVNRLNKRNENALTNP